MNRLLTTGVALSALLGTAGFALAQDFNQGPPPAYGQPMPPPPQAQAQPYAWQTAPVTDPHSSGAADRAYSHGLKTN